MKCVNLIPARRRQAAARRKRVAQWIAGGALYGLVLVGGCLACDRYLGQTGSDLSREARQVKIGIDTANKLILALCNEISEKEWMLSSARIVASNPDWSVMLSVLARHLGEEVVLERCLLEPVKPARPASSSKTAAASPKDEQFLMELSGLAQSQSAVSQFLLRLEKTRMFDDLKLIRTYRQAFVSGDVVAFRLQGSFDGRGAAR